MFSEENKFWFVNSLIIMINLVLTYFLDYNLVIFLLVPLLNSLLIVYLQYKSNLPVSLIAVDYVLKIALNIFILIFKKIDNSEKRKKFFEINKNNYNIIEYIEDLLDSMNKMVITISNKEVIYINKCAAKYFERKLHYTSMENTIDNLMSNHKSKLKNIKTFVDRFFESLKEYSPIPQNLIFQEEGKDLKQILYDILTKSGTFSWKKFTHLGKFRCTSENNCFDIFIKRLDQEVIEIFINDISEMNENNSS